MNSWTYTSDPISQYYDDTGMMYCQTGIYRRHILHASLVGEAHTTKAFESPNTAVQLINVMRQGVLLGKKAHVKWGDKG
jgi:hypothetical protein